MRIQSIIIMVIVAGMFVAGFSGLLYEGISHYNATYDPSQLAGLDQINNTYDFVIEAGTTAEGSSEQLGQSGITDTQNTIKTSKVYFKSIKFIPKMLTNTANAIGIPSWFMFGVLAIFILVIILAILYLLGIIKGGGGQ
jgi:hypothetical protein